jgi:hypothetical protein
MAMTTRVFVVCALLLLSAAAAADEAAVGASGALEDEPVQAAPAATAATEVFSLERHQRNRDSIKAVREVVDRALKTPEDVDAVEVDALCLANREQKAAAAAAAAPAEGEDAAAIAQIMVDIEQDCVDFEVAFELLFETHYPKSDDAASDSGKPASDETADSDSDKPASDETADSDSASGSESATSD